MKRWFFSYAILPLTGGYDVRVQLGYAVHESEEHPVATVMRWAERERREMRRTVVLISFQEVGPEVPETDGEGVWPR